MVKLYCDRCEGEIEKTYHVINFWEYDVNPKYEPLTTYATVASYNSETREGALKFLNSRKMYCNKCKSEIEKFIG